MVVCGDYYEGGWTTIYRCTPTKIEELLVVSCGVCITEVSLVRRELDEQTRLYPGARVLPRP